MPTEHTHTSQISPGWHQEPLVLDLPSFSLCSHQKLLKGSQRLRGCLQPHTFTTEGRIGTTNILCTGHRGLGVPWSPELQVMAAGHALAHFVSPWQAAWNVSPVPQRFSPCSGPLLVTGTEGKESTGSSTRG